MALYMSLAITTEPQGQGVAFSKMLFLGFYLAESPLTSGEHLGSFDDQHIRHTGCDVKSWVAKN
jgi:hypothetical protein